MGLASLSFNPKSKIQNPKLLEVVVTGIGLVSALGASLETSWQNLIASKSSIKCQQPFPELKPQPLALIDQQPAQLTKLTGLVVAAALKDAGLVPPLPDCGVVIGSSRSHQAAWEQLARQKSWARERKDGESLQQGTLNAVVIPSPDHPITSYSLTTESNLALEDWLNTLPHTSAIAAARQIGSHSQVLAPMAACATGIWAIAQAALLIQTGQCQRVIAGAVEAPITPLTLAGFNQMGALARTGAYPFDRHREGLVLGEGAAVLVLESAQLARQRSAPIYGKILSFGLTSDAYRAFSPEPTGKSAIAAVKQCLNRSCLSPKDIDYIHAHGTATQLNDSTESLVIQHLFPQGVPVSSTKGATGHTLGGSGVLGAAFCLMALKHQILPPCVGLKKPEFDLDFVTLARQSEVRRVLCLSFGFGGQNAILALGN